MKALKTGFYIFLIPAGVFMFVYGGYDDSPGAQGLGVVIFLIGVINLVRTKPWRPSNK